ncbi:MAG: DUF4062 domain-containing protein [Clostridia bacterium]|nr:DUF4062 domain-containing protein [Clostridia bacterium]
MELRPWTISVLSTSYDLEEYRNAVVNELQSKDIVVSAFEQPEFPVEANMHSHDACLVALKRADIAILIINKRSGGVYYNAEGNESITQKECLTAIDEGIPIFTFVKEDAWDERHNYKKQFNKFVERKKLSSKPTKAKLKKLKEEFDKNVYNCTYVDKVETINFIESMQHIYDTHRVSNWMDTFNNIDELIECVVGKLKGYSRNLIERIVKSQCNTLLNKHTSTAFGMSLGDVFKSNYYIEPPHELESGNLGSEKSLLSEDIHNAICSDQSVLVYGEAGYGKTTVLAKCFIEHVEKYLSNPTYDIPILLTLRNKGNDYHFELEQVINEELAATMDTKLKHLPYPYLDLSQIRTRFYCDGFDEMAEKLSIEDLDRIRKSDVFTRPLLLTCRYQFANRYLRDPSFSDKFGIRVRIKNWNFDTAKKYIDNYFNKRKMDTKSKSEILNSIDKNNDLQQVLDSPLLITMFLWYVDQPQKTVSKITGTELFKNWINELATRERTKINLGGAEISMIVDIWAYAAWFLYCHKVSGEPLGLKFDDLICYLEKRFSHFKNHINTSWFSTLFDCNNDYIIGTFHEQFMEYLVAKVLINACINKDDPYPEFLKMVMRPEINRYFRGIWLECSQTEREQIFSALYEQYIKNLNKTDLNEVLLRVHAIYHIARLDSPQRQQCIDIAFKSEDHISVLLSLYFGAIKMGNLSKEEEFYNLLTSDLCYDDANRGYHLAYYSDSIVGNELPFKDNETCEWTGTLKAFERHFNSDELGHFFLRRIDLVTMRRLIESRKDINPLTDEFLKNLEIILEQPLNDSQSQYYEFNDKVKEEYKKLVELYNKLK